MNSVLEMLRRYLRQESLQFLNEVDIENPHHYDLQQQSERKSSRRSVKGSEGGIAKKSSRITKRHTKQKSTLSSLKKSTILKRHSISFRYLTVLIFVCGLALARYYFISSAMEESVFLFTTFKTANDVYLGLIASQMCLSALAIYNEGDTIHYKHPADFFNEEITLVTNKAVPSLLRLATSNLKLKTGEMLRGLLFDVQFCDMLQLTAENDYLYKNCESALGGITQNTIAVFLQQYPKLLSQFTMRWKMENTQLGKDALLRGEEFGSLFSFSAYNQFGTMDAIYYHFMLPLITQIDIYLKESLTVVALTNIITGLFGAIIIICSLWTVYVSANERFGEVPKIIVSIPIRLLLSNPQFRLLAKNIQSRGSFWGIWM